MPLFLAVPLLSDSAAFDAAVAQINPKLDSYRLQANRGWLIKYDGTTVELSNKLGITGQAPGEPAPLGSVLLVGISGYYGRGPTDMWEWLRTRIES